MLIQNAILPIFQKPIDIFNFLEFNKTISLTKTIFSYDFGTNQRFLFFFKMISKGLIRSLETNIFYKKNFSILVLTFNLIWVVIVRIHFHSNRSIFQIEGFIFIIIIGETLKSITGKPFILISHNSDGFIWTH